MLMLKKNETDTRELSVEVQEIISKRPGWFLRNGISLFVFIIGGFIVLTCFITYPDTIIARAQISSKENLQFAAKLYLSRNDVSRITTGQKVFLKMPAYPFQEFGSVIGKIDSISKTPTDSGYLVNIILPNGLLTNYNKKLQYYEGLSAQGEIITEDLRLSDRILNQFKLGIKKR